ncbi:hypothetical protein K2X85_09240 [bacterium]|jgi:hypothetical protein|nr:hypothetical protein [bacterium]
MRRIVSLSVLLTGLALSMGCCHTCDVCDDCGYDSHYGVYSEGTSPGCSTCGAGGYSQKQVPGQVMKSTQVAGPVQSTVRSR